MNSPFPPLPPVKNPALDRIDELGQLAADSLRNASRYPLHARTYRDCADTYNLVAGSTASDLGLATMLWDTRFFEPVHLIKTNAEKSAFQTPPSPK